MISSLRVCQTQCRSIRQTTVVLLLLCGAVMTTIAFAGSNRRLPTRYSYEVVRTYPHDSKAFCQGLAFDGQSLCESTGKYGQSSVRRVNLNTGRIELQFALDSRIFGEGLTLVGDKLFQLTWKRNTGFIYDAKTLKPLGKFHYDGEGWGLTHDGENLILSDGSDKLRFMHLDSWKVAKTIHVKDGDWPVRRLNELEYVNGKILANVWHTNSIAIIEPETGIVTGWIDLSGLSKKPLGQESVLNGIAYDKESGRLFVTGKNWPELYEIKLRELSN